MKKWIWLLLATLVTAALFVPLGSTPPLKDLFLFPSSPARLSLGFAADKSFPASPYGKVTLEWDERGVPYVFGENEQAAAFGMGYAQARDRLFQMEMLNRTVLGTLTEVAGERALKSDMWWRMFRFEEHGNLWYEALQQENPDMAAYFQAFADGVNAYIETTPEDELHLEFKLLGFKPQPFRPVNMFNLIRYMDKTLCYGEDDLAFAALPNLMDSSLIDLYYPLINPHAYPIYPDVVKNDSILRAAGKLQELPGYRPAGTMAGVQVRGELELDLGSNNWAITGKKSSTGNAFLCNDTHLQLSLPGTWYEMHVVAGNRMMHGFSIAGSPFIISGFNNDVAWGMTNATWDLTDFYKLSISQDGNSYILDGKPVEFTEFNQSFKIKGGKTVERTYRESVFGPMDTLGGEYLALRWLGMMNSNEGAAFLGLQRASTIEAAYEAVQHFQQPPQNFVLADRYGHAGLVTSGAGALKPYGFRGIVDATSIRHLVPYVPMHRLLNSFDPERGWVGSCNQNHVTDSLSAILSTRYAPNSRGRRLGQLMEAKDSISREDLQAMQLDALDLEWLVLGPKMVATAPEKVRALLASWDGVCDTPRVPPTLFNSFRFKLFAAFGEEFGADIPLLPQSEVVYHLMAQRDTLPLPGGRILITKDFFERVWTTTLEDLTTAFGEDLDDWSYGNWNTVTINHIARIPALNYPPFGINGSTRTLNVATNRPVTHGPSMRTVIELTPEGPVADLVLPGGQSGRVNSPNYADQIPDWAHGRYHRANLPLQPGNTYVTRIQFGY